MSLLATSTTSSCGGLPWHLTLWLQVCMHLAPLLSMIVDPPQGIM
jgi:hypothetical protein